MCVCVCVCVCLCVVCCVCMCMCVLVGGAAAAIGGYTRLRRVDMPGGLKFALCHCHLFPQLEKGFQTNLPQARTSGLQREHWKYQVEPE